MASTQTAGLPEDLSAQGFFNKIAEHLITQGRPATSGGRSRQCKYRGPNGLMCAAGVVIPDDRFVSGMETKSVSSEIILDRVPEIAPFKPVLIRLQGIHDDENLWDWPEGEDNGPTFNLPKLRGELRRVADRFSLAAPEFLSEPAV